MADTAALRAKQEHPEVAPPFRAGPSSLHACSICLRVRHQERWVEVESAIQLVRSFESPVPPRLLPAICDPCATAIALRRKRKPQRDAEAPAEFEPAFSKAVLRFSDRPTLANFALYRLVSRELERRRARSAQQGGKTRTGSAEPTPFGSEARDDSAATTEGGRR
jgi:hypothetical protein